MDDETIRLILDMGGSAASVEEVRKKLDALKGTTHSTADSYEVLERQVGEYEVLERRVVQTTQQVVQAEAEHVGVLRTLGIQIDATAGAGARMGQSFGKDGQFGRGVLQASFAVQDFTSVLGNQGLGRAIASVQNNIPLMLTSFGAGAGLAGVVSVVSVGIGLLIDNWDKLTGRWKDGETEREAKRQKDLAKAIEATAAATEKLLKTPGPEQRAAGKDIQRAIDAFGGHAVQKEIEEALKAKQGDFGAEANRKMARDFVSRLLAGDKRAVEMLGDLDLHGDIGAVLRGGKTPEERFKLNNQAAERETKERKAREEAAEKKAKEDAEKAAKEAKHKEEQLAKKAERDAEKEITADQRLGRKVGEAAAKADAAPAAAKAMLDKIPLLKPDASAEELDRAMIANQEQMTANLKALQDLAQRAGKVGQENRRISRQRQQPMANYGW